jgi:hypothetical protein
MEPILVNDPTLADVFAQIEQREPIFHREACGATRRDFENIADANFWEVGASGNRYSREYVIDALARCHSVPHEDIWEVRGLHCMALGADTYLATYTLLQNRTRLTRRATIWQSTPDGWKALYHQGTLVDA